MSRSNLLTGSEQAPQPHPEMLVFDKIYTKPLYALVALALVLSLGIVAVSMAATVEEDKL